MKKSNESLFSGISNAVAGKDPAVPMRLREGTIMEAREKRTGPISRGEVVSHPVLKVDPAVCRMWEHHNRRYDLLDEQRCQDLIESFQAQGGQEFPAVVRRLAAGEPYQFEVICGARRHWTVSWFNRNNHPEYKFLIEVRTLTDEQAFRLADAENRDRLDISDYERGLDYKAALATYYRGSQKDMAKRLEISEARVSQYLTLAELPQPIVSAYPSIFEVREYHARQLMPLLADAKACGRILQKATELAQTQVALREQNKPLLSGSDVVKQLKIAAKIKTAAADLYLANYTSKSGKEMLRVKRINRTGLLLEVKPNSGATKQEVSEACKQAVEAFFA